MSGAFPEWLAPMAATLTHERFTGAEWSFERKLDGIRLLAFKEGAHVHGVETYDTARKKYVSSWTDSMSTGLMTGEGTHDAATKTMTGWMEGPDMEGKVTKMKSTVTMKDPNTRVFSMYNVGPDGKESLGMRITYTRRK